MTTSDQTTPDVTAAGRFDIDLGPAEPVLDGTGRFDFTKTWEGDVAGTGRGVMLSAGDPGAGAAGYVALETFTGTIAGRRGSLAFSQHGAMSGGGDDLTYAVVPGSGTDELAGATGTVELDTTGGDHRVVIMLRFVG